MRQVAFAGSFDPPTFGHLDIIERAAALCGGLTVIAANDRKKTYLFEAAERVEMLQALTKEWHNVSTAICPADTLLVDYLRTAGIRILVRGMRNMYDFTYESEMAKINKTLYPELETVFLQARAEFVSLSSSAVRELAAYHADLSRFAPDAVVTALQKKLL